MGHVKHGARPVRWLGRQAFMDLVWFAPAMSFGAWTRSVREIRQVLIGNELMLFSLLALVLLSGTGGCGGLEHPAEPSSEGSASVWRTEIVGLLLLIPGFEQLTFAQGLLGARSPKPTTLLLLNLPQMGQWIHRSRLCADLPKASSIGRSKEGHWNTMSLKEYPPALCKALAGCISTAVSGRSTLDAKSAPSFGVVVARWLSAISIHAWGLTLLASTVVEEFTARPRHFRHYLPKKKIHPITYKCK